MLSPKRRSKRRLAAEPLESRKLLAAHISELLIDTTFGDEDVQAVVELRAEPLSTFESGTHLALVDEGGFDPGEIHTLFDLGGLSVGSNGFLTFLQADSPHQVHPASNVLRSQSNGFLGLPDGRFTSVDNNFTTPELNTDGDLYPGVFGSSAFILFHSTAPVEVGMDLDADDDGVLDPDRISTWTIHDAVSVHRFVGSGNVAYSPILFAELGSLNEIELDGGDPIIVGTEGFGYVARVGESIGSTVDDWLAGEVREIDGEPEGRFELTADLFGPSNPYIYTGRDLDHFGEGNFVGGIRGAVLAPVNDPADGGDVPPGEPGTGVPPGEPGGDEGAPDPALVPRQNVLVLADTNGNGLRDELTFVVEPDEFNGLADPSDPFSDGMELTNAFPGVTITEYALRRFPSGPVTSEPQTRTGFNVGNRIFADGRIDWFSDSSPLRFDFYHPVREVSIDAIGSEFGGSPVYAQLDAFDAEGNLIASTTSFPLPTNVRRTISVSVDSERIARVEAYARDEFEDDRPASPFGRFDRLEYKRRELTTTTDEEGRFEFRKLQPGPYEVQIFDGDRIASGGAAQIFRYETVDLDLRSTENEPPVTEDGAFEVSENAPVETVIGTLVGTDPNGQNLRFEFSVEDTFGLRVRPATGEIYVGPDSQLDFESNPSFALPFTVTDPSGAQSSGIVSIDVTDANDRPLVSLEPIEISEATEVGSQVGVIDVSDEDAGQSISLQIIGGAAREFLAVDAETGVVTLTAPVDFERDAGPFEFAVRGTDNGTPARSAVARTRVVITDANDPPEVISDLEIAVSDSTPAGARVGVILATDQDGDSSQRRFEIEGGSGAPWFRIVGTSGDLFIADDVDLATIGGTTLELEIAVTDFGEPVQVGRAVVQVTIADDNQAPVFDPVGDLAIAEDAPAGSAVGSVTASDADGDSVRYQITGGSGRSLFDINDETGLITLLPGSELDFETQSEWSLVITATDQAEVELSQVIEVLVTVTDVNEGPVIDRDALVPPDAVVGQRYEFSLPEGAVTGPDGSSEGVELELDPNGLPGWLRFDPTTQRIFGIPTSIRVGTLEVAMTATVNGNDIDAERFTFQIEVGSSENLLHNETQSGDVNGDDEVTPGDALAVINFIRRSGSGIEVTESQRLDGFFDVSRDRVVSPFDALLVINLLRLARSGAGAAAEPTAIDALDESKTKNQDAAIDELFVAGSLF